MKIANDPLYYPRLKLAERLVMSLSDGIAHAFTLFAPRRMGKTQFLLNDVTPTAQEKGFNVFYFSFMDIDNETVTARFQKSLIHFTAELTTKDKAKNLLDSIDKISFMGASVSREKHATTPTVSDIIETLAHAKKPTLLLLDEVQELSRLNDTQGLIRSLRTGLDIHKDKVKVIFTGSSITGLQALFNDSKAPFFHFAHDIAFPTLDKAFTDHLAIIIEDRTGQAINRDDLFNAFVKMNYTPLYLRAIAQDMILDPTLSLDTAISTRLVQLNDTGAYQSLWFGLNDIDKAVLITIANGIQSLYSKATTEKILSITKQPITQSKIQASIKRLSKKDVISKTIRNEWIITEQAFKTWINSQG